MKLWYVPVVHIYNPAMEAGNIATQVLCKYLTSKNICILNLRVGEWGKFHQCACSCNLIYFTHKMSVASGSR